MEIYLINTETNEVIGTFKNVLDWGFNFVEYENSGRAKIYCDSEKEYFTDKPIENTENLENN